MADRRDPIETASDGSQDLYDVATWEERTSLDGLATAVYRLGKFSLRWLTIALGFLLLLGIGGASAIFDPQIGVLTALSAIPALGLAAYVWYSDATTGEPLTLLVGTFLLGVLTANFAAVINSYGQFVLGGLGGLGMILFFYLVVGPVEETVKLLAVRLYAYRKDSFNAVIDGAVYGAMAGLGFATIENALYITRNLDGATPELGLGIIGAGGGITAIRALAGPGHVVYSAFAGYYLGLAKFNPENAGPIVIKGLLIAAFIHATYNSLAGLGSTAISLIPGVPGGIVSFFIFVVIYQGFFGLILLRKFRRYRVAYDRAHESDARDEASLTAESTEFE
jgi:RsiW-degrading membrane proteinase PrsW (M82 family)